MVKYRAWTFTFVECKEKERAYFIYKSPLSERNDKYFDEFCMIKRVYGARKSELNKEDSSIVELDLRKLDSNYKSSFLSRKRHYQSFTLKRTIMYSILELILMVLSFWKIAFIPFSLITFALMVYSFISTVALKKWSFSDIALCDDGI